MMLQRVAGNAYSWWWASHIRTKQSKWLEQNLNDMEDKVSNMLEIIDDNGDSFAQRANMYYRKRPELLAIVEDTYRAYRALAERFDHISKDLQSANRTIATVCPDQVPFSMRDEDEENGGLASTSTSLDKPGSRVPLPKKDFRSQSMLLLRKGQLKKAFTSAQAASCPASGLNKDEALEEINKLQKEILEMQTEWEFVKNSYEQGYKKLCEIETNITEKQKRVCSLQDEYDIGTAIDDNEARRLMANRVLQSCQESLVKLQETHEQSTEEGRVESKRIKKVNETFEALRKKYNPPQTNQQEKLKRAGSAKDVDNMVYEFDSEEKEKEFMTSLRKDIEQKLEVSSSSSLTKSQLGEKIDDLVQRVVNLESAVFSENASVKRLKTDANELQEHVQSLEKDEETLVGGSDNTNQRICALEGELSRVKDVLKAIIDHNNSLKAHFTEASCNINHLSVNLHAVEMDEEVENTRLSEEAKTEVDAKPDSKSKESSTLKDIGIKMEGKDEDVSAEGSNKIDDVDSEASNKIDDVDSEASNKIDDVDSEASNKVDDVDSEASNKIDDVDSEASNKIDVVSAEGRDNVDSEASNKFDVNSEKDPPPVNEYKAEKAIETEAESDEEEAEPNWRKLYMRGLDDRERILLDEYSSVLRNYKNVRKKLKEVDKKNRDSFYELALQIRELKNALAARDEEIQSLRGKSGFIDENRDGNLTEYEASHTMTSPESSLTDYIQTSPVAASEGKGEPIEKVGMQERSLTPSRSIPTVEDRIRSDIDELLEENLAFWLRFSTSFHQIQKYQTSVQDLKSDLSTLKERKQESSGKEEPLGSEARPIYAHFREIKTELTLWLENNAVLKDEVQCRYTSLCNIHEEIVRMSSSVNGHEREPEINRYQAAKFQGEILNMKQENIKVSKELKAGFDRVQQLKQEVENVMASLEKEIEAATSMNQHSGTKTRSRIPLRSFLFGIKLKNKWQQKGPSMFACGHPQLQRQYSYLTEPEEPS